MLIYFNANHNLLTKESIPTFYLEIQNLFMKYFKEEPINVTAVLTQHLVK